MVLNHSLSLSRANALEEISRDDKPPPKRSKVNIGGLRNDYRAIADRQSKPTKTPISEPPSSAPSRSVSYFSEAAATTSENDQDESGIRFGGIDVDEGEQEPRVAALTSAHTDNIAGGISFKNPEPPAVSLHLRV
jgi:hypothetical protein